MPFGSERSHFAHSPHLLAALILLIPPEIGGELKRKARSRGCWPGFCCTRSPGAVLRRASSGSRLGAGVDGKRAQRDQGGWGCFYIFRGCGQFWEEDAGLSLARPNAESPGQAAASAGRAPGRGVQRGICGTTPRGGRRGGRAGGVGGSDLAALPSPAARVQEPHPTLGPAPCPALTRCNSPAHFSPRDLPSVNSSLT